MVNIERCGQEDAGYMDIVIPFKILGNKNRLFALYVLGKNNRIDTFDGLGNGDGIIADYQVTDPDTILSLYFKKDLD